MLMLCVTKSTTQVATTKAYEDGWRAAVETLTLQGVEYFVDLIQNETYSYICRFASLRAKRGNPDINCSSGLLCRSSSQRREARPTEQLNN